MVLERECVWAAGPSGFPDDPEWRAAHADGETALHFRGRLESSKTEVLEFAGLPARLPGYTEPGSTSSNRKACKPTNSKPVITTPTPEPSKKSIGRKPQSSIGNYLGPYISSCQ